MPNAAAADYYWTGKVSARWDVPGNWSTDPAGNVTSSVVPDAGDNARKATSVTRNLIEFTSGDLDGYVIAANVIGLGFYTAVDVTFTGNNQFTDNSYNAIAPGVFAIRSDAGHIVKFTSAAAIGGAVSNLMIINAMGHTEYSGDEDASIALLASHTDERTNDMWASESAHFNDRLYVTGTGVLTIREYYNYNDNMVARRVNKMGSGTARLTSSTAPTAYSRISVWEGKLILDAAINASGTVHALRLDAGQPALLVAGSGTVELAANPMVAHTSGNQIGGLSGVLMKGNGVLNLNGANERWSYLQGDGGTLTNANATTRSTLITGTGNAVTFSGAVSGNLSLQKEGGNAWTLAGPLSYSGETIFNSASIIHITTASGANSIGLVKFLNAGATLNVSGNAPLAIGGFSAGSAGGTIALGSVSGAGAFTIGHGGVLAGGENDGSGTFSGVISGSRPIVKNGGGALTLTGANTFTGTVNVTDGALVIGTGAQLASSTSSITIGIGATFAIDRNADALGTPFNFSRNISGSGTFLKAGTEDLVYSGNINLEGVSSSVSVSGGKFTNTSVIKAATVTFSPGTTFINSGTVTGNVNFSGTTFANSGTITGNVTFPENSTFTAGAGSSITGTVELGNSSTVINEGGSVGSISLGEDETIRAGTSVLSVNSLTATGKVSFDIDSLIAAPVFKSGAKIPLISYSESITWADGKDFAAAYAEGDVALSNPDAVRADLSLEDENSKILLRVENASPALNIRWKGEIGGTTNTTWAYSTENWTKTSDGSVEKFYLGDHVLFDDSADAARRTVALGAALSPGSVTVDTDDATGYTFTGTGSITGTGKLIKKGTGTLLLSNTGANTYSGGTDVLEGTLEIGANSTPGTGALTVSNDATLKFGDSLHAEVKVAAPESVADAVNLHAVNPVSITGDAATGLNLSGVGQTGNINFLASGTGAFTISQATPTLPGTWTFKDGAGFNFTATNGDWRNIDLRATGAKDATKFQFTQTGGTFKISKFTFDGGNIEILGTGTNYLDIGAGIFRVAPASGTTAESVITRGGNTGNRITTSDSSGTVKFNTESGQKLKLSAEIAANSLEVSGLGEFTLDVSANSAAQPSLTTITVKEGATLRLQKGGTDTKWFILNTITAAGNLILEPGATVIYDNYTANGNDNGPKYYTIHIGEGAIVKGLNYPEMTGLGNLVMEGGIVDNTDGNHTYWRIDANITVKALPGATVDLPTTSYIRGKSIALTDGWQATSQTKEINVEEKARLEISAPVHNSANTSGTQVIIKTGPGKVVFTNNASTFTVPITINGGVLEATLLNVTGNTSALGHNNNSARVLTINGA
ncbi:MAG: autotransporter-associated beta strand repeat-containing protein, partial [Puniceicoccales bacterium]|nr:autotransporter-associated beta strand repeat-containing protein [Puniceicoccales bacterium]